jgi:hypothetical protein
MSAAVSRAAAYHAELERIYANEGSPDALIKRLASWLGDADQSVLLFLLLCELRELRAALTAPSEPPNGSSIRTRVKDAADR